MSMSMSWELLSVLIPALGGWEFIKYILNRRANKKMANAQAKAEEATADMAVAKAKMEFDAVYERRNQALSDQLDRMNAQIEFKDKRIMALNEQLARQASQLEDKDKAYSEQTNRLRKTQDQLLESNENVVKLTQRNGDLQLRLSNHECVTLGCLHRDPPNEFTKRAREQAKKEAKKK